MSFQEAELPALSSIEQANYLGIRPGQYFKFSEIKADVVILEVFNTYCYNCQRQAPNMNELYRLIEKAGLSGKIKMIGLGMSNSQMEVGIFKKKHNVLFPLFADPDNSLYRLLGRGETPHVSIIKNKGYGNFEKIYTVERNFPEPEKFLESIIKWSGIDKVYDEAI